MIGKRSLRSFLRLNPFASGWTEGLFYREKMRAIHRIAPDCLPSDASILEIGGGRSGMAVRLYPGADVTTLDRDPALAPEGGDSERQRFVCGDACRLPFPDASFDLVTMFDVLEHIEDDRAAAREALRVTRPAGAILVSTPCADWRYPIYGFMRPVCPPEEYLMDEWGHVRRGYSPADLERLFGRPADAKASFINRVTAFYHDVAFSRLGRHKRKLLYAAAAAPTLLAYAVHRPWMRGTEIACKWQA